MEQLSAPPPDKRRRRVSEAVAEPAPRRSESIATVGERSVQRLHTGFAELDRVLGGGLVPGSLVLVGGDPGIGKSTLLLQTAEALAQRESVLYVSAEESAQQVKLRWSRLGPAATGDGPQLLAETDLDMVLEELETRKVPSWVGLGRS